MNRNFDVRQVNNGFEICIRPQQTGEGYPDNVNLVAISKSDVQTLFSQWLEGNDKPAISNQVK